MTPIAKDLEAIDKTVQKTLEWLKEIERELGCEDRPFAFQSLRAVFRVIRNHVSEGEIGDVLATLPPSFRKLWD